MDNLIENEVQGQEDLVFEEMASSMRGKKIVIVLIVLYIFSGVVSVLNGRGIVTLVVNCLLSFALYKGVRWVRYFLAVTNGISAVVVVGLIPELFSYASVGDKIFVIVMLASAIAYALILLLNKDVKVFLDRQRTL